MTDAMFARTKTITEYRTCDLPDVDLSVIASHDFDGFKVDVVDSGTRVDSHARLLAGNYPSLCPLCVHSAREETPSLTRVCVCLPLLGA